MHTVRRARLVAIDAWWDRHLAAAIKIARAMLLALTMGHRGSDLVIRGEHGPSGDQHDPAPLRRGERTVNTVGLAQASAPAKTNRAPAHAVTLAERRS